MKSFARKFYVLSLTATFVACGGGSGGAGTSAVSIDDPRIASDYTVFQLDPLPGHFRSTAHDINDKGQIVGWSGDLSQNAVLWTIDEAGAITIMDLGVLPGGTFSIAYGINNLGQIVGLTNGASGRWRPFIWTADNGMRDLGVPEGGVGGSAHSINDTGQVVGAFVTTGANIPLADRGTFALWTVDATGATIDVRDFGKLGGKAAVAWNNNVHGNVVGDIWFAGGNDQSGFFWSEEGGLIEIDNTNEALGINDNDEVVGLQLSNGTGGYVWTAAGGLIEIPDGVSMRINNSGQATGRANVGLDGQPQAYVWDDGQLKLLPMHQNAVSSWAFSINEAGSIVGWSTVDDIAYANYWMFNPP